MVASRSHRSVWAQWSTASRTQFHTAIRLQRFYLYTMIAEKRRKTEYYTPIKKPPYLTPKPPNTRNTYSFPKTLVQIKH
jgi:hypothetical protein